MSSAKPSSSTKRTASIARSIARSTWLRQLGAFLLLDAMLVITVLGYFVLLCNKTLPDGSVSAGFIPASGVSASFGLARGNLLATTYDVALPGGETHSFLLACAFEPAAPILVCVALWELVCLVGGLFATPRIRRKLKPLNDLALTAEAIGSAAAAKPLDAQADTSKIESLERAISSATVESPQVTTGDADLRSIEVALNGLLRRMQEAKLQQMRFVSDASHELRTPIAVIQGYVNMLDRWGKTDESVLDESIEALKSESAHMKELVEQLLFLARGDSGHTTLNRTTFNLAALVEEVREESAMIDAAHAYVSAVPANAPEDPAFTMVGDIALVKQSMRVIVQNAAKYSPDGSSIALGAALNEHEGTVAYSVQDEGAGMAPDDAAHAFERFWRSDEARSGSTGGTGLGLSIAKWIVDAHGGTIDVLSVEGVGTRFSVRFERGL